MFGAFGDNPLKPEIPFAVYETSINRSPITDATMKLMSEPEPFKKYKAA